MSYEHSKFVKDMLRELAKIDYVKPGEVPNIDLYMDQVTTFMDNHLSAMKRHDSDKILTKTMINNYTKHNLLPPPVKKKYSKDHMLSLIFIFYFKNLMSIGDIQTILGPLNDKFFSDKGSVSMEYIYKEIYQMERSRLADTSHNIISMCNTAENSFSDVEDDEEREYLQILTFVSLLCFDMYIKKEMIENITDAFAAGRSFLDKENKTADKNSPKKSENKPEP